VGEVSRGGTIIIIFFLSLACYPDHQRVGVLEKFPQRSRRIEKLDQKDFKNLKNYFH
jgi:hypothetical protein